MGKLLEYQRALRRTAHALREIRALGDFVVGLAHQAEGRALDANAAAAVAIGLARNCAASHLATLEEEFDRAGGSSDEQLAARALELMRAARDELAKQYPDHDWNFIVGAPPSQPEPPPVTFKPDRRLTSFVVDARRVGP